jgi:hypothetical protein
VYGKTNSPSGYGGYFIGRGYFRANSTSNLGTLILEEAESDYARLGFRDVYTARWWQIAGYIGAIANDDRLNIWNSSIGDIVSIAGGNPHGMTVYGKFDVVGGPKNFKIDHPLDPANKYLYHAAQEAPEVQNVYNGVVTLDASGEAVVSLPDYFEALNTGPFRYQLTAIGAPMPNLYIAQEIQDNTFRIAGGEPGKKVSWEVTAVRNDPYLRDHPFQAEEPKPEDERGTYLYPEGYGQPKELGLNYQRNRDPFEAAGEPGASVPSADEP